MEERIRIWVTRLKNPSVQVRLEAINSLEAIGDAAGLFPLADCFANDPDADARALARRAGKTIYYNLQRQAQVEQTASEEERRRAAEILAKARAKKMQGR